MGVRPHQENPDEINLFHKRTSIVGSDPQVFHNSTNFVYSFLKPLQINRLPLLNIVDKFVNSLCG